MPPNSTSFDIFLRLLLDKSTSSKTKADVDALGKSFHAMDDEAKRLTATLIDQTSAGLEAIEQKFEDARRSVEEMQRSSEKLRGVSSTLFVAGAGVVGGLFALANKEANRIKDAGDIVDATTARWLRANDRIAKSTQQIGRSAETAVLPLLEKAADLAEKASAFTEDHPEILRAALNTGLVLAGLGALGLAVSRGIRLVADLTYISANAEFLIGTKIFQKSAHEFLLGALAAQKGGGALPAAAGLTAGQAGLFGVGLAGSVGIATLISGLLDKVEVHLNKMFRGRGPLGLGGAAGTIASNALTAGASQIFPFLPAIDNLKRAIPALQELSDSKIGQLIEQLTGLGDSVDETADQVADAMAQLAGSAQEGAVVRAFEEWQKDDARIVQEAADRRVEIVAEAEARVTAVTAQFANRVATINANANNREADLISNFNRANNEAFLHYQEQRADILKDAEQEIRDIEEDHQERLRKLKLDSDEQLEELTAARDALGIVKEQRRFDREEAEENRASRIEIARRRRDLAERLQELDAQYQAEKAQRLAQFQEALAENEARRQAELKQAAAAHAEELKQIQQAKDQQLRELQESLNAERIRRREMFIAQVRDLDASLLGERTLKNRYYQLMLQDAERWLANYRTMLAAVPTATPPTHDYTGYAYSGIYRMAANGEPEYVLSGAATRAAENMIGGRLTQDALLSAVARGAGRGMSRSLTIQDNSRFDGRISANQVREIKRQARDEAIQEFFHAISN